MEESKPTTMQQQEENNTSSTFVLPEKYKQFYEFHGPQLYGMRFPIELVPQLVDKLENKTDDFSNFFDIQDNQDDETFQAASKQFIDAKSAVFTIGHQFTFKMEQTRHLLEQNPELVQRLRYNLQYFEQRRKVPGWSNGGASDASNSKFVVEFDNQNITDPTTLEIPTDTVSLSLFDNLIESLDLIRVSLTKLPELRVLFLNYNPVSESDDFRETIAREFPHIEFLNSKLTRTASDFALKFAHYNYNLDKTNKIRTETLKQLNLAKRGVSNLTDFSIFSKFTNLIQLDVSKHDDLTVEQVLAILAAAPKVKNINLDWRLELQLWDLHEAGKLATLAPGLQSVNDRHFSYKRPVENEEDLRFIVKNIWKIANTYRIVSETQMDETNYWYLDELSGISIQHSDTPNVKTSPFLYAPTFKLAESEPMTLMWPIKSIATNEVLYRDFLLGFDENSHRSARLGIWFQIPEDFFTRCITEHRQKLARDAISGKKFITEFKQIERKSIGLNDTLPHKRPLKVITDSGLVEEFLTAPEFEIVGTVEEADIIQLTHDYDETIRDHYNIRFCNQFPLEWHIVQKNHLANTVQSVLGSVEWLQPTYNLKTQMNEFVGEYRRRQHALEDNVWIIKAFNLARSIDMMVTDNIDQIMRQTETIPRLAQKYISNPVRIYNKKIDLRYIIAVRSIEPLEVFLYKIFWIRTSNNDFTTDYRSRDVYETHFTVMNYGKSLKQIHFPEFIEQFEKENPEMKWDTVYGRIKQMVRELFMAVTKKIPGMAHPNCRGVYGMDVMIEDGTFQPKLLELTFSPDCGRACKYHPHFYNDMFSLLYLNATEHPNYEPLF